MAKNRTRVGENAEQPTLTQPLDGNLAQPLWKTGSVYESRMYTFPTLQCFHSYI